MAALTLGDKLRGKGQPMLSSVQESEHLCWKSHVNENIALAGGWCWSPFSTVPRIYHTLSLFVLPYCHFLLWKSRQISSDGADHTQYPTWQFSTPFSTPFSHLSVSTSNLQSGHDIQSLTVCFQSPCHPLSPFFSVYSRIWVRKYIFRWLIPPRLISAPGWWLPAVLCCTFVWRTISKSMFCRCNKSDV